MRRLAAVAGLAAVLVLLTVTYRFITLGGPLGGFDNDQFVHLSRAQQMLLGELPVRDFPEPGLPLTHLVSAVAQATLGPTLFSEAALTIAMLGVSSAMLFFLAYRASGSLAAAFVVAVVQIAMAPRFYNYPKLFVYCLGIPALWRYVDRPSLAARLTLAAAIAVAFLFRHDHGVYLAMAGSVAVVVALWPDWRTAAAQVAVLGLLTIAWLLPYFVFVQLNGGLVAYVRTAAMIAERDAGRTNLDLPVFELDRGPLVAMAPEERRAPTVNVRWRTPDDAVRMERERGLGLLPLERVSEDVWKYELTAWTPGDLAAIVADPAVTDTHGIDRSTFRLNDPEYLRQPTRVEQFQATLSRVAVLPGVLRASNAVPFLYYLFVLVPPLCLFLAWLGVPRRPDWPNASAKVAVVACLSLVMTYGILRGGLEARLADVTTGVGILIAWLAVAPLRVSNRGLRLMARVGVALILVLTVISVDAIEGVRAQARRLGIDDGVAGTLARAEGIYRTLSVVPPAAAWPADAPGIARVARYVHDCSRPDDRVLALAYVPELFFLAGRGFAGGHVWIMPGFFTTDVQQQETLARVATARVPIVIAEPDPLYSDDYRPDFPLLDAFLRREYRRAGAIDLGDGKRYDVLVRNDLTPSGTYAPFGLPCFAS